MKAFLIETYGVALGFAIPTTIIGRGWLILSMDGHPTTTWNYQGIEQAFADARMEQGLI